MPRRRYNNQFGTITDNPLTSGAVTVNSAAFASLPAVVAPDYIALVLDPDSTSEEIVWVMAHTASATVATIWRGRESTTPVAHVSGAIWKHGPTAADYAPNPGVYVPDPTWNDGWLQGLYNSGTTPVTAGITGASTDMGGSACTDQMTLSWWALWRAGIIARGYTNYGDFIIPTYSASWTPNPAPSGWPFIMDLAPTQWAYGGPFYMPAWSALNNGANPMMHYTHKTTTLGYRGRSFDLIWWDTTGTSGWTWIYNLNGGAAQTVTMGGTNTLKRTSITSSTPGWTDTDNQVINFMSQSNANGMGLVGVCSYPGATGPGTSGVGFSWMAVGGGFCMNEIIREDKTSPADRISQLQGPTNTTAPFNTSFGFPFNYKLFCVGLFDDFAAYMNGPFVVGVNPTLTVLGADPSDYRDGLKRIRQVSQALNGSTLFVLANAASGVNSDISVAASYYPQNVDTYYDMYYNVAQSRGCGVISHHILWGERGLTLGYLDAGNPHPNNAGQVVRANDILAIT